MPQNEFISYNWKDVMVPKYPIIFSPQILNSNAGFANIIICKSPRVTQCFQGCAVFLLSFYMVHFGPQGPEFYIILILWRP